MTPASVRAYGALAVLTALNFVNYVDRHVLSAVLKPLKEEPAFASVSDGQLGLLQAGFLLPYIFFSPLVAALGQRAQRKYVVSISALVWSLATLLSGYARDYPELMAARALVGIGEAGYAAAAPTIISDLFSVQRRARMLGIFYVATPVGSALGFVVGGLVAQAFGWRAAFWAASAPGLLLGILVLLIAEPPRGGQENTGVQAVNPSTSVLRQLWQSRCWINVTLGGTLMCFGLGALAFWTPTYLQEAKGLDVGQAGFYFGATTVGAGVVGTVLGSLLGDWWARDDAGAQVRVSGLGLVMAVPFAAAAPLVDGLWPSLVLLFIGEVFIFLNVGPLNAALISSVPPAIREVAVGTNILIIHLFGDAISPALVGLLRDSLVAGGVAAVPARSISLLVTSIPFLASGAVLLMGATHFRALAVQRGAANSAA